MLNLLAALPMCYFVVAVEAGNPNAVYQHEMAHCWGWVHGVNHTPKVIDGKYRAAPVPFWYRLRGGYPEDRLVVRYEHTWKVKKLCDGNPYGCQWGGLQK